MAGTATCSGEGGMIPPERDHSTKWYYQCIQSRYGFNPHHLMLADACEFFIGQGCKVGLGGHLMGQKVTEQVAEMRSLPVGHRPAEPGAPSGLARSGRPLPQDPGDPRGDRLPDPDPAQARRRPRLRRRPDGRQVRSRHHLSRRRRGGHGCRPARRRPRRPGSRSWRPSPRPAAPSRTSGSPTRSTSSSPAASATAATSRSASSLGAKAVAIGHSALMALNCNKEIPGVTDYEGTVGVKAGYCYHCHTGRCPVGITTQDPGAAQAPRRRRGGRARLQLPPHAHPRGADAGAGVRQDERAQPRAGGPLRRSRSRRRRWRGCRSPGRRTCPASRRQRTLDEIK